MSDTIVENLIDVSLTPSPAGCGNPTGSVTASVSSVGPTTYTYSWSDGSTSANLSGVFGDVYSLTVTNADGCTWFGNVTVPDVTSSFSLSGTDNDATCATCPDGSITTFLTGSPVMPVTYLWNNGATTDTLLSLLPGTYIVIVTDSIECTSIDTFVVGPTISVEEIKVDFDVSVFPNPVNNFLQINSSVSMKEIKLFAIDGRIIRVYSLNSSKVKLDLTGISKGIYTLGILTETGYKIIKVIKE